MKRLIVVATMLVVCSSLFAQTAPRPPRPFFPPEQPAQPPPPQQPPPPPPPEDVISEQLFPPDLIMRNQEMLHLQDAQRSAIRAEVVKLQTKVVELQWQLSDEAERMATLLRATPIDEAKVLEQSDKVMSLEREIKRLHLGTLVRIKNALTPDQVARLQEARRRGR